MENWLPVVGYEGLYEVSDRGRVRSLARTHSHLGGVRSVPGRILRPARSGKGGEGRSFVSLSRAGRQHLRGVGVLVLEAFVGPRPPGLVARHWPDRDPTNCALANLSWATQSQNMLDRRAHGTDHEANKTHCPQGHEYVGYNIKWKKNGARDCRECMNEANRRYRARKKVATT